MKKTTPIIFLFLTISIFIAGCASNAPKQDQTPKRTVKPTAVAVQEPLVGPAYSFYETTSTLEPQYRAEIRSKASGVIQELFVEEGQKVEEGDLVLKLENSDQTLELKQAKIAFDQAKREYERHSKMHEKGVLADEVYDQSAHNFESAKADLELAELRLSYTEVTSPLTGTLVKRLVDLGAHIDTGTALFEVMDMDPMLVRIHVPANRMSAIAPGQVIDLICDSNQAKLKGEIDLISPIVDPGTGTVKVTASIKDASPEIKPGEFVQVRLITDRKDRALLVPNIAIFEEKGQKVVFTADGDKARRHQVTIGLTSGDHTEIIDGLSGTEKVIIKGQRDLKEGQAISILDSTEASNTDKERKS